MTAPTCWCYPNQRLRNFLTAVSSLQEIIWLSIIYQLIFDFEVLIAHEDLCHGTSLYLNNLIWVIKYRIVMNSMSKDCVYKLDLVIQRTQILGVVSLGVERLSSKFPYNFTRSIENVRTSNSHYVSLNSFGGLLTHI